MIGLGFLSVIICGALLLFLPFSTQAGQSTSFLDALFTATSAVCVTGLVVQDTATHWTLFGQIIIILLIQIGGLGVVTAVASVSMLTRRKIGLRQRNLMQEAFSTNYLSGIVKLTSFSIKFTFLLEGIGMVLLFIVYFPLYGFAKGLWYSVFHAISAFCNAGFDLMGINEPFSSLTSFHQNPIVNITIMGLIVVGGLGFLTWDDIRKNKLCYKKYGMQTKTVLFVSTVLIVFPAIYFFFGEFQSYAMSTRFFGSFFQSVTMRTAGFNTLDLAKCSEAGWMLMIILMLIGGSPGSTAGGMKTTTIAILFANIKAVFWRREDSTLFKKRVPEEVIRQAAVILMMYLTLFLSTGMIISRLENIPLMVCLFETASAIGTVGLTLGITTKIGTISHILLIILMFFGRVGGLTLIFAANRGIKKTHSRYPKDHITVG